MFIQIIFVICFFLKVNETVAACIYRYYIMFLLHEHQWLCSSQLFVSTDESPRVSKGIYTTLHYFTLISLSFQLWTFYLYNIIIYIEKRYFKPFIFLTIVQKVHCLRNACKLISLFIFNVYSTKFFRDIILYTMILTYFIYVLCYYEIFVIEYLLFYL